MFHYEEGLNGLEMRNAQLKTLLERNEALAVYLLTLQRGEDMNDSICVQKDKAYYSLHQNYWQFPQEELRDFPKEISDVNNFGLGYNTIIGCLLGWADDIVKPIPGDDVSISPRPGPDGNQIFYLPAVTRPEIPF